MDTQPFGEWIEDQYKARGWSQKEFAVEIGVSNTTVSNWVNGGPPPREPTCDRIAEVLSMDRNEVRRRAGRDAVTIEPEGRPAYPLSAERIAGLEAKLDEALRLMHRLVDGRDREEDHK